MIGTTHTMKRLATGLALAATTAALVAPAGLAGGKPDYGPPDGWAAQYLTASQGVGPFVTDTLNSARVGRTQTSQAGRLPDGFATDTLNSARVERSRAIALAGKLPAGFVSDTIDTARGERRQLSPTVSGGFDVGSFGIGIGAGIGGLLCLAGIALAARSGKVRRLASA